MWQEECLALNELLRINSDRIGVHSENEGDYDGEASEGLAEGGGKPVDRVGGLSEGDVKTDCLMAYSTVSYLASQT